MKKCEYYKTRNDGVMLVRTYSDSNFYIQKENTDEKYSEAIDIGIAYMENGETKYKPKFYSYIETDEQIIEEI